MVQTVIIAPDHMVMSSTLRTVSRYFVAETAAPLDNQPSHGPSWKPDEKKAP